MASLIFGLIVLLAPFLLLGLFSDKKTGFIFVLFFTLLFHTTLALLSQLLGIFYYWVIIAVALLANLIIARQIKFFLRREPPRGHPRPRKNLFGSLKNLLASLKNLFGSLKRIDWFLVFVFVAAVLTLYQAHYNYTGKINLATDQTVSYHEVKNMRYAYPYFSDEWYAVSLIKGAISGHSLPAKNTLQPGNIFFLNMEIFFHSLVSEIILLLGLNPLTQYAALSLFINALIIILAYIFLRLSNLSKPAAAISALSLLYITCGANLPGLWHLIPFNYGILFFLLMLCFMAADKFRPALGSAVLGCLFYPPMALFFAVPIIAFLPVKFTSHRHKILKIYAYSGLFLFIAVPVLLILVFILDFKFLNYILSRIFFVSFSAPYTPQYLFFYVIPLWAIVLAVFALPKILKEKIWLLAPLIAGAGFWLFYSFSLGRFIIEYERVAVFSSIIIVLMSGFALKKIPPVFLIFFLIAIPFYTRINGWENLMLKDRVNNTEGYPKAPANNYLTGEDVEIFSGIKNKRFLSIPWKGTVIGVATDNFPIVTKEGTISVGKESFTAEFSIANCAQKSRLAKINKIEYVYLYPFSCPGFDKVAESREGLVLYKTGLK